MTTFYGFKLHSFFEEDSNNEKSTENTAPIFYLNCEHVLFVYILKQRRKFFADYKKKFADFQEFKFFYKIKNL